MDKVKIIEIIKETVETMHFVPVEIHIGQSRRKFTVKVVIYHQTESVGASDCARISNIISRRIDVEDLIDRTYNLVVESPGVDRKLAHLEEYQIFQGRELAVYLNHPKEYGVKGDFLTGTLRGLSKDQSAILVEQKESTLTIPFADFNRCTLYFDIQKYLKSGGR